MNPKRLLSCLASILLVSPLAFGDTIANWTFETSQPGAVTLPASPGAGTWLTNIAAENGIGTAAGWHAGATTYSSPAGNASFHSFSSTVWTNVGDCYQFAVSSVGFQNIAVSYDQTSSGSGPRDFIFSYSTDGVIFTPFGSTYIVLTNASSANNEGSGKSTSAWSSSGSQQSAFTASYDLSSITALNNQSVVYFRVSLADTTNAPGNPTTSTVGANRVDNFLVSASTIPGFPSITTQPQTNTVYWGDTAVLNVVASGTAPLNYQWYYPNMSSPLSDGNSGYGVGTIYGSTTNALILTYVNTNQTGNYQVVVGNPLGSVTSQIAQLTVNLRTPIATNIAYLRTLQDYVNWLPIDTTNLYSVTGVVTTPFNMSASGNSAEFFMQDNRAGICVFVGGGSSVPNAGDLVRVTGPLSQFSGMFELNLSASNPAHSVSTPISTGRPLPVPIVLDFADVSDISYMETNVEGSLVIVSNVFLQQATPEFISGSNINMTNVNRRVLSLYINAGAWDVIAQTIPPFAASIAGVMSQHTSNVPATNAYELDILQYSDLVSSTNVPALPMPLKIQLSGTNAVLTWWAISPFTLQAAPNVTGIYTNLDGANNPFTNSVDSPAKFYRLIPSS